MTSVIEVVGGDPAGVRYVVMVSHRSQGGAAVSRFAVKAMSMNGASVHAAKYLESPPGKRLYPNAEIEQITRLGS